MRPRNFYIEAEIDGRKTELKAGPKKPDGGFKLYLSMLDGEKTISPVKVTGTVNKYGQLELEVTCTGYCVDCISEDGEGHRLHQIKYTTDR